jgi:hypothetical protein
LTENYKTYTVDIKSDMVFTKLSTCSTYKTPSRD